MQGLVLLDRVGWTRISLIRGCGWRDPPSACQFPDPHAGYGNGLCGGAAFLQEAPGDVDGKLCQGESR